MSGKSKQDAAAQDPTVARKQSMLSQVFGGGGSRSPSGLGFNYQFMGNLNDFGALNKHSSNKSPRLANALDTSSQASNISKSGSALN